MGLAHRGGVLPGMLAPVNVLGLTTLLSVGKSNRFRRRPGVVSGERGEEGAGAAEQSFR